MIRTTTTLAALAVVAIASACGGGAPAATGSETTAAPPTVQDQDPAPSDAGAQPTTPADEPRPTDPPAEPPAGNTGSYARVTVGDETYEFEPGPNALLQRCDTNFFGGYWLLFDSGIEIVLPGENWAAQGVEEQGRVEIRLEDDTEWVANPETLELYGLPPGDSQIDTYSVNGSQAQGTATFVDPFSLSAGAKPVAGSFETNCAADFGQ